MGRGGHGKTGKCIGCKGDHWFMEVRGNKADGRYQITCNVQYKNRDFFHNCKNAAYLHLFKKPYAPSKDFKRRLGDYPKKVRAHIAQICLDFIDAAVSDTEQGGSSERDSVLCDSEFEDDLSDYVPIEGDPLECNKYVHTVVVKVRTVSRTSPVQTYLLFDETPFSVKLLKDSGADVSLVGDAFLRDMVNAGRFISMAHAKSHLKCTNQTVNVEGVHGNSLTSTNSLSVDLVLVLNGKDPGITSNRITIRDVTCFYHPDFPSIMGEDALEAAGLMPAQNVEQRLGIEVSAKRVFGSSSSSPQVALNSLLHSLPTIDVSITADVNTTSASNENMENDPDDSIGLSVDDPIIDKCSAHYFWDSPVC